MIPSIIKCCLICINPEYNADTWLNRLFSLLAGSYQTKQTSNKTQKLAGLEGKLAAPWRGVGGLSIFAQKPVFAMVFCQKVQSWRGWTERSYIRVFFPSSFELKSLPTRAFFFIKYVQFFFSYFFSLAGLLKSRLNKKCLSVAATQNNIFLSLAGSSVCSCLYPKRSTAVNQSASVRRTGLQAPLSLDEPPNKNALPIWWGERDKPGVWGVAKGEGGAPL